MRVLPFAFIGMLFENEFLINWVATVEQKYNTAINDLCIDEFVRLIISAEGLPAEPFMWAMDTDDLQICPDDMILIGYDLDEMDSNMSIDQIKQILAGVFSVIGLIETEESHDIKLYVDAILEDDEMDMTINSSFSISTSQ